MDLINGSNYSTRFKELIMELSSSGSVVVLIDEYDKPILDHVDDIDLAEENRDVLKGFYNTLKSSEDHIELVFITGVSKFSKTSIFSDLNNFIDLTVRGTVINLTIFS
jgi:hypothetical protein